MTTAALLAGIAGWIGTFALHSTCALLGALAICAALRGRGIAWQERLLRFSLWVAVVSASLQCGFGGALLRVELPAAPVQVATTASPVEIELAAPAFAADPAALPAIAAAPWRWDVARIVVLGAGIAAAVGLALLLRTRRRLDGLLAGREPETDGRVLGYAAAAARAQGLRHSPHVSRSAAIATPIAFGCVHPEICLPERVGTLGNDELRALLAHEVAHLRRRDAVWTWTAALLQACFPWQLLYGVVRRRWAQLVELRCDAIAAGHSSPTAVARCLVEVAEWLRPPATVPAVALGMASRPSGLRIRIEAALHERATGAVHRGWSGAFGGLAASALVVAAPGVGGVAGDAVPTPETAAVSASPAPAEGPSPLRATLDLLEAERVDLQQQLAQMRADLASAPRRGELEPLIALVGERLLGVETSCQRLRALLDRRETKRPPIAQR